MKSEVLLTVAMDYSFIIRKAVKEDAPAIHNIMQSAFEAYKALVGAGSPLEAIEESVKDIEEDIAAKDVFIAFVNGAPVGTARVGSMAPDSALLTRLGVVPGHQNIGIGKSLMSVIDRTVKNKKYKFVHLYAAAKNYDLIRFYYSRGFYVDSTSKDRGYVRALLIKEYV
jgi:predicted N-acetyltransferase YhbS